MASRGRRPHKDLALRLCPVRLIRFLLAQIPEFRFFMRYSVGVMRYLVKARVKAGQHAALLQAIRDGSLGQGSIAGDEYLYDMEQARLGEDGIAHWVETCYCSIPLQEERPYWEKFFQLLSVKDAHNRKNCKHENGSESWACSDCDCTRQLEERLGQRGKSFLETLRQQSPEAK